jgi:phosphohistidine phosphatase
MKTVYFIRHAKSSWSDFSLKDSERPLNKRGLRDAPFMAKLFVAKERHPDIIHSSPAVRAYTTAKYFAQALSKTEEDVQQDPKLYLGDEDYIINKIQETSSEADTICFFGHNPTTTHMANIFHEDYIPNVPTAAIVKIQADIADWKHFTPDTASFVTMHYPKQYFV